MTPHKKGEVHTFRSCLRFVGTFTVACDVILDLNTAKELLLQEVTLIQELHKTSGLVRIRARVCAQCGR